jgi:hypothetical protein
MSEIASIDCGYLATVQAMADELWTDPIKNIDFIASAESARAVLENQQVNLAPLQSTTKNYTVSLEWLQVCDLVVEACSDDCSIDGDDASPVCKEYELSCLGELAFKVFDRVYRDRTIDAQKSVAYNMEIRKKALDEALAQAVDAALLLYAGTNVFTGSPGTVGAHVTTIPAASWNDNIWGYFARVARGNKFRSPYGISGDNLFQLIYNRLAELQNADGKGNVAKMGDLRNRMYLDPENIEVIAAHYTFLIHKTAVAILNKAWYPVGAANAVKLTADRMAWSEASRNLPGIYYDIFTERGCTNNDYYTAYKLQAHGLFAVNPTPCSETNTGILAFECV